MKSEAIKTTTREEIPSLPGYTPVVESTGKEAAAVNNSLEVKGKPLGRNG